MTENPLRDVLQSALQREIDAYNLYHNAAAMVESPHSREILDDLATQELGHRNRLQALLDGQLFRVLSRTQRRRVVDLKITDYLVEVPLAHESDFQNILIVAGKREKASHDLYAALARVTEDEDTAKLFEFLAAEELTHKNRVESLYEEIVLKDN
ncbi:MAG: ferritin family protein [Chloroflexota bacterium]